MTSPETVFAIESGMASARALEVLERDFRITKEPFASHTVTYYDSFDWRILAGGGTLTGVSTGGEVELCWSANGIPPRHQCRLQAMPSFVWDLPSGNLRADLEEILEMRRLLPVVEVRRGDHLVRILNKDEKTVARVRITEAVAAEPGSKERVPLEVAVLQVLPVRGYDKARRKVLRTIETELGLEPSRHDELRLALAAIGVVPARHSSKVRVPLDPAQRADEALRQILRALLDAMQANEDGTRRDLDSEFLHDFRVAVRRTRSALSQIKGVLPPDVVDRFKGEFSWLGQATGPTRDLDVYLLKMPAYAASLPSAVAEDLKPLHEFLVRHQRLEQRRLVKALDSPRYERLIRDWNAYLDPSSENEPASGETPPNAVRTIAEVAAERVWRTYRKVAKEGRAIGPETPAEALHELRIRCKKLRYLLEFFRGLYPAKQIRPLIASLKQLQDNLGDFNDYEVQQGALADFARQMRDEGETPVETLLAMGRLVDHLESGQAGERRAFAEHFAIFDAKENQTRFRRLFAPRGDRS